MVWLIRSKDEKDLHDGRPLYWSNDLGWVDKKSATVFRGFERGVLNLPVGGEWVRAR